MSTLTIAGQTVTVSNLDKLWWPESGISKGDILNYYINVAPWLLPHLRDRPLVLTRYPDGASGKSFYQKNTPAHAPDWLRTYPIQSDKGRVINYCLADDTISLVWIVNSGGFEIHPFLSRVQHLEQPDFVVFDLDPMERVTWPDVCQTACVIKTALDSQGLRGYPKTSGATGLQIFVPIAPKYSYEQVRAVALLLSQAVQSILPQITTLERQIAKRDGKLYLDCLQNALGKTLAAVYGVRPQSGATVSTPLTWEEVAKKQVKPADFTVKTVPDRLRRLGDLHAPVLTDLQSVDGLLPR